MRKKLCVYKTCRSDSRYSEKDYMKDVFFIPFPKPKRNFKKCEKWIEWLGRPDYPISRVNDGTYLCSKHFVGGKGPSNDFPDPIHSQTEKVSILKPLNPTGTVSSLNICVSDPCRAGSCVASVAMNLNALFKNFVPQSDWAIVLNKDEHARVMKLKNETNLVLHSVKIDKSFNVSYQIIGKNLSNTEILTKLPQRIESQCCLKKTLTLLDSSHPCFGNSDPRYANIFENRKNKKGFLSQYTGAIHSENCQLLIMEKSQRRCIFCLKQGAGFRVALCRRNKSKKSSATKFCNMSKKELVAKLRDCRKTIYRMKLKLNQFEKKFNNQIKKKKASFIGKDSKVKSTIKNTLNFQNCFENTITSDETETYK